MREVKYITQTTENKFLNMYVLDMESDTGRKSKYFVHQEQNLSRS